MQAAIHLLLSYPWQGQTLHEKMVEGKLVLEDGEETQENPDLQGPRSGSLPQDTHKRRSLVLTAYKNCNKNEFERQWNQDILLPYQRLASRSPHRTGAVRFFLPLPIKFFIASYTHFSPCACVACRIGTLITK